MKKYLPPALAALFLAFVLGVYFMTLAPDLVWDPPETGTLLASAQSSEFFRFSPSPFYFLLAQGWKRIPWGTLALRGNFFSMGLALLSVGLVYFLILRLGRDFRFALFGGLIMALSPLFWPFVRFANFYTLLLFLSFLYFSLLLLDGEGRLPFVISLLFGLAVSTAPAAIVLALPLALYLWVRRHCLRVKGFGLALLGIFLGLFPAFGAWFFFGLPLGKIFFSLSPLSPFWSSSWQNLLSFAELFFFKVPWPLYSLAFIGALWGVGGRERAFLFLGFLSFLVLLGIYPLPEYLGVFIFPISIFVIWAALGAKVVWELIYTLSNTEIGAAFETRLFVLVFRLKRKVAILRYLLLGLFFIFLAFLPFKEFRESFAALDYFDNSALEYGSKAQEKFSSRPSKSLVLAQEGKFLSSLRYFSSLDPKKKVIVTTTSLVVDPGEYFRLRKFYPELWLPSSVGEGKSESWALEALEVFIDKNLGNFEIFLTLNHPSQGRGVVYGKWGEYTLVAEEPLYRGKPHPQPALW